MSEHQSESQIQAAVRLGLARIGYLLFRNNRGAFKDKTGRWVRYGLANDSKPFGKKLGAHDLIGWRTITITADMVGKEFAQFVSIECKEEGWTPADPGKDDRQDAQMEWLKLVRGAGGVAYFISHPDQLAYLDKRFTSL